MQLSDREIRSEITDGRLVIEPLSTNQVQPASYDCLLGDEILVDVSAPGYVVDPTLPQEHWQRVFLDAPFLLAPGDFILGTTHERIEVPNHLAARIEGRSSLGRTGLFVHVTAGFVDPGFKGKLTLEIYNARRRPIVLRAGMPICQLSFTRLTSPAMRPYGDPRLNSKYQNQETVTPSAYHRNKIVL